MSDKVKIRLISNNLGEVYVGSMKSISKLNMSKEFKGLKSPEKNQLAIGLQISKIKRMKDTPEASKNSNNFFVAVKIQLSYFTEKFSILISGTLKSELLNTSDKNDESFEPLIHDMFKSITTPLFSKVSKIIAELSDEMNVYPIIIDLQEEISKQEEDTKLSDDIKK